MVAITESDRRVLAVGFAAKEMIGRTPGEIIAYRPMKDGVIADYRVTQAMLRYFMTKAMGRFQIFKPEVMVSVPTGVTSTERRAVVEAAIRAGAKSAYVVKESVLAAIGAGIPIQEARGNMVVDIGGGTLDVAVISLGGIVASISVKCAGDKLDRAIIDYVKKAYNLGIGEKTAEDVKIAVGSALPVEEELIVVVRGRDFITGLPRTAELKTNDVVKAIGKELREMIKAIRDVLQETPPELASDIIDRGITMTGGTSMLRNFPELVLKMRCFVLHAGRVLRWTIWTRTKKQSSRSDEKINSLPKMRHHAYYVEGSMREFDALKLQVRPLYAQTHERFGIDEARELIQRASLKNFKDTIFLIAASSITSEAQQALLKLFEEPQPGTTFILVMPHGVLLPTLKSRMLQYPERIAVTSPEKSLAKIFLKSVGKSRSDMVVALLKDEEGTKERVRDFLEELEIELHKKIKDQKVREGLEDIAKVRSYVGDRAPALKMLLEHLGAILPTV